MLTRIVAVALATASFAFVTAHAQTSGTPGTGGSTTTSPSTTSPSTGPSTGSTGSSPSTPSMSGSGQQAQQPMGTSTFDPTKYKTKTECLNAAAAQHASTSLCNNLK